MCGCFEGEEIDFKELTDPNTKAFRNTLFKFLEKGINQGPYVPQGNMPINAPNDPNVALGMNMFREMGGQSPNYTPWQAPQTWNNAWNPQWPNMNYPSNNDTNNNNEENEDNEPVDDGEEEKLKDIKGRIRKPIPA